MLQRPFGFAVTFLALFALVFAFMAMTDALPDTLSQNPAAQKSSGSPQTFVRQDSAAAETPIRAVAKDIGLDVTVINATTTDVEQLDAQLMHGAVRYPTSAPLGVDGTMLLFGHSSYLPIVYNQHYKTFNGIQNLKTGQTVSVYSGTTEYRYSVTGVRVANATEDVVELPSTGKHLVLVTCDSFATKSTRYVVNADFVGAYSL